MVQEDLAISPCRLYESYFLLSILVVNVVEQEKKIIKHDTVAKSNLAHKKGYSINHSDITATKTNEKMRDEKGESDKAGSKQFVNCVIMVSDDLVDQEGEGGGLLAYPENVQFEV